MDDTLKIQALLDGENKDIYLPGGVYEISDTLIIHSNTRLRLSHNTVIRLRDHAACYMLQNDLCETKKVNQNITIEGGAWDGNNENQPQRGKRGDAFPYVIGHIMRLDGVENLALRDITFKDPICFSMQIMNLNRFTVENITFDHNLKNPNMDGVHVQGSAKNGYIRNIKGTTNDDLIALNCNDCYRTFEQEDVSSGDIENIVIDGVYGDNAFTGVRLLSCGSELKNVSIRNIFGTYRFYGISFTHHNVIPGAPVWIDNIDISNVYCAKHPQTLPLDMRAVESVDNMFGEGTHKIAVENKPIIWFAPGINCGNISITNLHRTEYAETKAPTILVDSGASIVTLMLNHITQRFVNAPEVPMLVNRGCIENLNLEKPVFDL